MLLAFPESGDLETKPSVSFLKLVDQNKRALLFLVCHFKALSPSFTPTFSFLLKVIAN